VNSSYHTWSVVQVTRIVAATKIPKFTNAELTDNALWVYWFYDENSFASLKENEN
jgi:hypothetical protein